MGRLSTCSILVRCEQVLRSNGPWLTRPTGIFLVIAGLNLRLLLRAPKLSPTQRVLVLYTLLSGIVTTVYYLISSIKLAHAFVGTADAPVDYWFWPIILSHPATAVPFFINAFLADSLLVR
jgi:hypothetical protein